MVAVIHSGTSLRNVLNYNETKVRADQARCLAAGYYPIDAADLNFQQKLRCLELRTELNQRTKVNSVHISLNFHPSEQPSEALLCELAEVFLQKIGFAGQPYLLYQHFDAGHPHIHLLTTNIKADGKAIHLHNIGRERARPACLEMERAYGLIPTDGTEKKLSVPFEPAAVQRIIYGKTATKRAINGVINAVTKNYNFTSLAQLNAVLGLYNITADTGGEGSRMQRHGGLVFRLVDGNGNKVGVPIKASDFSSKPTLKNLQRRFEKNTPLREQAKTRLKTAIDLALLHDHLTLEQLTGSLKNKGIAMVLRYSADGHVYGITYVDHERRTVVNGGELGKRYSAKGMLERCSPQRPDISQTVPHLPLPEPAHHRSIWAALTDTGRETAAQELHYTRKKKKKKRTRLYF